MDDLGTLAEKEYPGRFIILGRDPSGQYNVAVYGMTGRKETTKARRLVFDEFNGRVNVVPIGQDNPTLLHYIAMCIESGKLSVGDGKKLFGDRSVSIAEDILFASSIEPPRKTTLHDPINKLAVALGKYDYKSDESNTPRIGGYADDHSAAVGIVRRAKNGAPLRAIEQVPLINGEGSLISTYDGLNVRPAPAFASKPFEVRLPYSTAEEAAHAIYGVLRPELRIAVAACFSPVAHSPQKRQVKIMNAAEEPVGV